MTQTLAGELASVGIPTALGSTDSKHVIAMALWMYKSVYRRSRN